MTQYNLVVTSPNLETVNGFDSVVTTVYAALYAIYDSGDGQSIGKDIVLTPQEPFIPFSELTEDIVKQWVYDSPEYTEMLAIVDAAHEAYISNTTKFVFNTEA